MSFAVNKTAKFAVVDPPGAKIDHVAAAGGNSAAAAPDAAAPGRAKTRMTKSTGKLVDERGKGRIGGPFTLQPNPAFIADRKAKFEQAAQTQAQRLAAKPREKIQIKLPDGAVREGVSYETTPMDVAKALSNSLAKEVLVAEVKYSRRIADDEANVSAADGIEIEADPNEPAKGELWDLLRPLIGDCELRFLTWEDRDAQAVFWHSSAHCLGLAMERRFGCHLTHGPPIDGGFFYDCYMGSEAVGEKDFKELEKDVQKTCKSKQTFDRLLLSKEEALDMFKYNPFKREYIETRIPEGGCTTVYRNGDFIDLCRGPHVPFTTVIQAFATTRASATQWLAKADNDPLQRVYGVSFPDKPRLKKWQEFQEQAKQRDHRRLGQQQELFFFHELSPGSAFFLPHGQRLYNRLVDFIKKEYWKRGYHEVQSPNVFNMDLWVTSGHALHYREGMFRFEVEGQEFGMKPMNCPAHCLMFQNRARSYRELPLRLADFGVLHRNELSGTLTGLTRVRRFCQDDAHIFCRPEQIEQEVVGALDFMKTVYDIFGMSYKLELSTKPAKALGDDALWESAEAALANALDAFAGPGKWRVNPGDGAFYGPKIDIKVFDAMERMHQCATVQLDFQLPIRFGLRYRKGDDTSAKEAAAVASAAAAADGEASAGAASENGKPDAAQPSTAAAAADSPAAAAAAQTTAKAAGDDFERPVMVHRAMLGSVERMIAVLTEHYGGRWPFWLSPRQALVVPVTQTLIPFAAEVRDRFHAAGFYVDVDDSTKTLNKKIREGETARYNFILVVGDAERRADEVNIRQAGNVQVGNKKVDEAIAMFNELVQQYK